MTAMRRTVWTLLTAWLLQLLLASSGWALAHGSAAHMGVTKEQTITRVDNTQLHDGLAALGTEHAASHPGDQGRTAQDLDAGPYSSDRSGLSHASHVSHVPQDTHGASSSDAHGAHMGMHHPDVHNGGDNHHCCAVGLGLGMTPQLAPLPQAAPHSVALAWLSLSTRPDLRPPI